MCSSAVLLTILGLTSSFSSRRLWIGFHLRAYTFLIGSDWNRGLSYSRLFGFEFLLIGPPSPED
jgi:hypothetical protein